MKTSDLEPYQRQAVYDTAVLVYSVAGQTGVEDLAHALLWEEYHQCEPCESRTPWIDDSCMVCGSQRPDETALPFNPYPA